MKGATVMILIWMTMLLMILIMFIKTCFKTLLHKKRNRQQRYCFAYERKNESFVVETKNYYCEKREKLKLRPSTSPYSPWLLWPPTSSSFKLSFNLCLQLEPEKQSAIGRKYFCYIFQFQCLSFDLNWGTGAH